MAAKAAMSDDPFMSFLPIGEIFVKFTGSFTFGGFVQFPVASRIGIGIGIGSPKHWHYGRGGWHWMADRHKQTPLDTARRVSTVRATIR
jgi:hypothetical protein